MYGLRVGIFGFLDAPRFGGEIDILPAHCKRVGFARAG